MKYDAVIWDVDGTLLDTQEGLVAAYHYTLNALNLPSRTNEEIATYIGPTPQTVFMTRFGLSAPDAQAAADIFRARYKVHDLLKARVYDGIFDVLEALKISGLQQAIATNKRQDYAVDICAHFGIDHYCHPIYGADNDNKLTKSDLICQCLQSLKTSNAVMVGDTAGDQTAAREAGIDFIGVNYGYGFKGMVGYADSPDKLMSHFYADAGQ